MLGACSVSDQNKFRANCKGKLIEYSNGELFVSPLDKGYIFNNGSIGGSQCQIREGVIFCYNETSKGNLRMKEQLAFDRNSYTLSDIRTTIMAVSYTHLTLPTKA